MKYVKSVSRSRFRVGSKVVCINDDFSNAPERYRIIFRFPVNGRVYTVRKIRRRKGGLSFLLYEVVNDIVRFPFGIVDEIGFYSWRFRPLEKKKKKIADQVKEQKPVEEVLLPVQ
jgi:hypothetical protein